jgi:hypothetical protein
MKQPIYSVSLVEVTETCNRGVFAACGACSDVLLIYNVTGEPVSFVSGTRLQLSVGELSMH